MVMKWFKVLFLQLKQHFYLWKGAIFRLGWDVLITKRAWLFGQLSADKVSCHQKSHGETSHHTRPGQFLLFKESCEKYKKRSCKFDALTSSGLSKTLTRIVGGLSGRRREGGLPTSEWFYATNDMFNQKGLTQCQCGMNVSIKWYYSRHSPNSS